MGSLGRITGLRDLPADMLLLLYMCQAAVFVESGQRKKSIDRKPKAAKPHVRVPVELSAALKKNKLAAKTFESFSPSCRREYVEWISAAKRPETKETRARYHGVGRNGGGHLQPCRPAVSARIVASFQHPLGGMQHHGSGLPHEIAIGLRYEFDIVACRQQLINQRVGKARLDAQVAVRRAPAAPEQPAWRINRALEPDAIEHVPRENCCLRLRLAVTPHCAIGKRAAVLQLRQRRTKRVRRQPPRFKRIQCGARERKAYSAVLHQ